MVVLIYLVKLIACTALLYGYYSFALRNKRFHQYNRFFLLASMALSVVLPMINIPWLAQLFNSHGANGSLTGLAFGGWEQEVIVTAKQRMFHSIITVQNVWVAIYVLGLLLTMYPILKSFIYIRSLAKQHPAKFLGEIRFYDTSAPGTPFSFFNAVFWNDAIPVHTEKGQQILKHELFHIKQKHSYDIMFMQVISALLWFNPFYYLINRELKIIHEFLADEYAVAETDKHQYAELLVMQSVSSRQIFISNQFFFNQIKRRITMILQNSNNHYSYIRKVMAVPVLALVFCACSLKNKDEAVSEMQKSVDVVVDKVYVKPEVEAAFPGDRNSWGRFLNKTFRYPQAAQEQEVQGTVIVEFTVEKDGAVTNIKALDPVDNTDSGSLNGMVVSALMKNKKIEQVAATKEQTDLLRNEAIRVIEKSGKWVPASEKGEIVASKKKQPIRFVLVNE